jgi:hypothetical protein
MVLRDVHYFYVKMYLVNCCHLGSQKPVMLGWKDDFSGKSSRLFLLCWVGKMNENKVHSFIGNAIERTFLFCFVDGSAFSP